MRNFLFGVATVFVTQLLILAGQLMMRRRDRADLARAAVMDRARAAADRIMDLLNKARKFFSDNGHTAAAYDDDRVYDVCHEIKAAAALIPDAGVRDRLETLTTVLWYGDAVADRLRKQPVYIGHVVYNAGVEILGAFLRGEPIPALAAESLKQLVELKDEADVYEEELSAHVDR
ncbi:MAG: hypothetical protein M3323_01135 [Actinomycetota bacterium]|nr:hypothetical protein [Actinomycetota bacterium]